MRRLLQLIELDIECPSSRRSREGRGGTSSDFAWDRVRYSAIAGSPRRSGWNPIVKHGDRGGQRGGSLGQMREEHAPSSLTTLVRSFVTSPLLSSSLPSTFRSVPVLFLLRRTEHMALCVHACTQSPGYDSRTTHAFT